MSSASVSFPQIAPSRARAVGLVVAVFIFFFAAYIFTATGDIFSTGDTTIRMELAENISGRASVQLNGWKLQVPHHYKKEWLDPRVSTGVHGDTYSTYLLGQPLVMIPLDWLGSRLAVDERWPYGVSVAWVDRLVGPLFGALEVMVFFLFAMRLGVGLKRSLLVTAIFGFATSVWPDEQSVLEHTEVAFFLLLGFYFAFRFKEQGCSWWHLVGAGAGIGGAAITRYQDAFLGAIALGVYLLLPGGRSTVRYDLQRLLWLLPVGLGLAPFVATDLWYNWIRFGTMFATGHHETLFGNSILRGAAGLLVSPGKGLLWYCPTIFLLVIAAPLFAKRYGALAASFGVLTAGFVLLYSYVTFWHGDPCWGPRYLYPIVPFLSLPLVELFRRRLRLAALVWLLTAVVVGSSFTIQFSAVTVSQWRTWYRVISYEENQGYQWQWIASRYRYFWNPHESPLYLQVHGLYQMAYDSLLQSNKYELVPPDEDPILDGLNTTFAINQWSPWWASNEFDWWMGEQKIMLGVIMLVSIMFASGVYIAGEAAGAFAREPTQRRLQSMPEAA